MRWTACLVCVSVCGAFGAACSVDAVGREASPSPDDEPRPEDARRTAQPRIPDSFACAKAKTVGFERVVATRVPDVTPAADAPPPVVTNAADIVEPWGKLVTIDGAGLGNGTGGEYLSFGDGAHEIRLAAASANWRDSRIVVAVPLGAEGKIVVHTRGGAASAGTFTSTWRASAVLPFATEDEAYGRTLASLDTPEGTYVVRSSHREGAAFPDNVRLSVHRFTADAVDVAAFDGLGPVTRASLARGAKGEIDLALVTGTSRLHVARIGADAVVLDDGCVPAKGDGTLAFARTGAGRVAWVTIIDQSSARTLVRLVDDGDASTWKVTRAVPTTEHVGGDGLELADGSVAFAWGEGAGGLFDAKSAPMISVLSSGAAALETTRLAGAMDDYIQTRLFAVGGALAMTYCNTDDTGFLSDTSSIGVRCRVLSRTGPHEWSPFDGYPYDFENRGHDFGVIGGRIASVYRVRDAARYEYRATADAAPAELVGYARDVRFVRAEAGPVFFVENGDVAAVVRPR